MGKLGVSYSQVSHSSVWYVVDARNELCLFEIKYPKSAEKQKKIAESERVSSAGTLNTYIQVGNLMLRY